ncbi:ABC transporter substrate-binding protein [Amphibacillus cookii]|uniref:ABC transporter substrate-binding protein n=1 Tax=Amphibacillus cookii TaxID=767787 RepID=UPI00195A1405|nr:ABC transporter substrate-binding protein [Amphibacillus cookii]MBM7542348.1 AraC-like DNA-binding protein [Amphibacillus cookii]
MMINNKQFPKHNFNWSAVGFVLHDIEQKQAGAVAHRLATQYQFIMIRSGKALVQIDQHDIHLATEGICFIHPNQVYQITSIDDDVFNYTKISFQIINIDQSEYVLPYQDFPLQGSYYLNDSQKVLKRIDQLVTLSNHECSLDQFKKRLVFEQIIALCTDQEQSLENKRTDQLLAETKHYIDTHFDQPLSMAYLAKKTGLSQAYFAEMFKKVYGQNVSDYITRKKTNKTKQLLIQTEDKLRSIANQVGYSDEFYLSKKFKQIVGVSPSLYRKQRKRKIAAYDLSSTGHLLALNIYPYAAPIHPKWTAYYYQKYRYDIPVHLSAFQINKDRWHNLQLLKASKPDLIICKSGQAPEEIDQLLAIAPVFFYDQSLSCIDQIRVIAQYLGEEQEYSDWLIRYQDDLYHSKQALPNDVKRRRFLPLRFYKGTLYLDYSATMRELIFDQLSFQTAMALPMANQQPLSLEKLLNLNPDWILLNICQETETLAQWAAMEETLVWQGLKAVRYQQVFHIASDPWRECSAYAYQRVLAELTARFESLSK